MGDFDVFVINWMIQRNYVIRLCILFLENEMFTALKEFLAKSFLEGSKSILLPVIMSAPGDCIEYIWVWGCNWIFWAKVSLFCFFVCMCNMNEEILKTKRTRYCAYNSRGYTIIFICVILRMWSMKCQGLLICIILMHLYFDSLAGSITQPPTYGSTIRIFVLLVISKLIWFWLHAYYYL